MDILTALVLGIVQGLTEFIPVSSTAHLVIFPQLLGWQDPGLAFDVILHLGTLTGVVVFFWRDYWHMLQEMFSWNKLNSPGDSMGRLGWLIVIGTIPAGIMGIIFKDKVETTLRSPQTIAISLIVFALILWWSDAKSRKIRKLRHMNLMDAIFIGCAQAIALIPGVSRSGITITAGLVRSLEREGAARFAFLLSTPVILGGGILGLKDLYMSGLYREALVPLSVGFVTSAVSGFMAIKYLLSYLSKRNVNVFVYYRIILGIILLLIFR